MISDLYKLQKSIGEQIMLPLSAEIKSVSETDSVKPSVSMTGDERLQVYRQQYWYRLMDCMMEDYPGLAALLGHDRFTELTQSYLTKYPSRSFALESLGMNLPKFLKQICSEGRLPQVAYEIALVECAENKALFSHTHPPPRAVDLPKIANGKLRLRLQPHVTIVNLRYAVDEFLSERPKASMLERTSNAVNEIEENDPQAVPPRADTHCLLIHRLNEDVLFQRISNDDRVMLQSFRHPQTLETACTLAAQSLSLKSNSSIAQLVQESFFEWSRLKLLYCVPVTSPTF